jgi:hypothetical protein
MMFPISVYVLLIVIDILLFIYMLIDFRNLKYGNIIAGVIASLLAFYIAMISVSGTIVIDNGPPSIDTSITNMTTVTYPTPNLLQDDGLMWFWILVGVIQSIVTLLMGAEAYDEWAERGFSGDDMT